MAGHVSIVWMLEAHDGRRPRFWFLKLIVTERCWRWDEN
jgi:hypothetical protein